MTPTAINPIEMSLRQFSEHNHVQASTVARMSGESIVRHTHTPPANGAAPATSATSTNGTKEHLLNSPTIPSNKRIVQIPSWMQTPSTPAAGPSAPPLPTQLGPFQTGFISFSDPIPVGGSMSLAIFADGSYSFSGNFHDSGAPSYDVAGVWVIVSTSGRAFSFDAKGHLAGTFESGSRDCNFSKNGSDDLLKQAYADLCDGYHWKWSAHVNWDVQSAVDEVVSALKAAGEIIGAVIAVVALVV